MKSFENALEEYVSAGFGKRAATLLTLMDGIESLSPPESLASIILAYRAAVYEGGEDLWSFVSQLDTWRREHQVGRDGLFDPLVGLLTPNFSEDDNDSLGELIYFFEVNAAAFADPDLAECASISARFVSPISLMEGYCRVFTRGEGVDVVDSLARVLLESLQSGRPLSAHAWTPEIVSDFWRRYPGGPGAWVRYLQPECRRWRWVCKEDWGDGVSAIVVDASGGDPDFSGLLTALGILCAQDVSVQCADA